MADSADNQYLTFGIDGDIYAVPVGKVREVLEYIRPTKLPRTAAYLKGLINVRGSGIPVVDLRARFGLPEIPATQDTAIIVLEVAAPEGGGFVIGALTDEVHEVVDIAEETMEAAPRIGARIDAGLIRAIGKQGESFVILLDIDKAFLADEAEELARAAKVS